MFELTNGKTELFQWDKGVKVSIDVENVNEVHFANLSYGISRNVEVLNGFAEIPPEVLQSGADVYCWLYVRNNEQGYTKLEHKFNVVKRPKPADYIYKPTEILSWETLNKTKVSKSDILKEIDIDTTFDDTKIYNANVFNDAFNEIGELLEGLDTRLGAIENDYIQAFKLIGGAE